MESGGAHKAAFGRRIGFNSGPFLDDKGANAEGAPACAYC